MSVRFMGIAIRKSTQWVYKTGESIGVVTKDNFGNWTLTNYGRQIDGKMSCSNYLSVPTFI